MIGIRLTLAVILLLLTVVTSRVGQQNRHREEEHDESWQDSTIKSDNDNENNGEVERNLLKLVDKRNQLHTKHEEIPLGSSEEVSLLDDILSDDGGWMNKPPSIEELRKRLEPRRSLRVDETTSNIVPHQLLHLHHMKTGGTSTDHLLQCGMRRYESVQRAAKNDNTFHIPYYNIHECSSFHYQRCVEKTDPNCWNAINASSILSYCAPLSDLKEFGWTGLGITSDEKSKNSDAGSDVSASLTRKVVSPDIDKMTVLRHPVDRVWSMFRFQTRGCYQCRPLLDIYEQIDSGNKVDPNSNTSKPLSEMCMNQLLNHQVRNMRTNDKESVQDGTTDDTQDAKNAVAEAIHNLHTSMTIVGLTKELPTTAKMMAHVWPWLASVEVEGSEQKCQLPHANASPRNNRCADDGRSHWDLPDHPDEKTREAILAHNQLDLKLYEAGVAHFEAVKEALGLNENEEDYDKEAEAEEKSVVLELAQKQLDAEKGHTDHDHGNHGDSESDEDKGD